MTGSPAGRCARGRRTPGDPASNMNVRPISMACSSVSAQKVRMVYPKCSGPGWKPTSRAVSIYTFRNHRVE